MIDNSNENTKNNVFTLEKVIKFYMSKQEHYPISDMFMINYRQDSGEYIDVYEKFKGLVIPDFKLENIIIQKKTKKRNQVKINKYTLWDDEDDVYFFYCISRYLQIRKYIGPPIEIEKKLTDLLIDFNGMKDEEILCHTEECKYFRGEPNQKWHFLISWCAYKLLVIKPENEKNTFFAVPQNQENNCITTTVAPWTKEDLNNKPSYWTLVRCPELRLWMYEAAYDGEIITIDKIMQAYSEAVNCRLKKEENKDFWYKCWKDIEEVITKWQD